MQHFEMREYFGDYEDVAEFWQRTWAREYAGRIWMVWADKNTFHWLVGPGTDSLGPVAYYEGNLVAAVFSVPYSLRVGTTVHRSGVAFGLTVDPRHRRLAVPIVERLRRDNAERGIDFVLATVLRDPTSSSHRFWTKYAEAFPKNLTFLFPVNYWIKSLAPQVVARAGIERWERMTARLLGPLLSLTPHGNDPHVRPYRATDLESCVQLLETTSAGCDWALLWTPEQLSRRLAGGLGETLLFERDGRVCGMVNFHYMPMQARQRVLTAALTLWADDRLSGSERTRFLSHLCYYLRGRGVHIVSAPRCAMMPASAFVANLFLPVPGPWDLGALWTRPAVPLPPPKSWSLLIV
ncbi:MAG: hypothetical protein ACJ8F3_14325 [Xanthobacteraceae bacterium]